MSKRYNVFLEGTTPILFHKDDISFSEKVKAWMKDPDNKKFMVAGDDRSPAWTWIGYLYTDRGRIGISSDCLMTMLREAGAKVLTGKGKTTFKKQTQYGLVIDRLQFDLMIKNNDEWQYIDTDWIDDLLGNNNFAEHQKAVEAHGFRLHEKRARVGTNKHIRVRPCFDEWAAQGTITVYDEESSGLSEQVLSDIFRIAGEICGLGDWRPNSPKSGSYGKFVARIQEISRD